MECTWIRPIGSRPARQQYLVRPKLAQNRGMLSRYQQVKPPTRFTAIYKVNSAWCPDNPEDHLTACLQDSGFEEKLEFDGGELESCLGKPDSPPYTEK